MKYAVIKNNRYTGVVYDEVTQLILNHHLSQGESIAPIERLPVPLEYQDEIPIYGQRVDLEIIKKAKLLEIAVLRYLAECNGIVYNGIEISTDRESRATLAQAAFRAKEDPTHSVRWKAKNGWFELDAPSIIAIAGHVETHVQNCFEKEFLLQEQIAQASSEEELEAIKWEE